MRRRGPAHAELWKIRSGWSALGDGETLNGGRAVMLDDQIGRVESQARVQGEGLCNTFQVESLRCIGGPFVVAGVVASRAVLVKEDSH